MKPFYRLVNPVFEQKGIEYDTMEIPLSPRKQRSINLFQLFKIAIVFWQRTGVQLSTAIDAMLRFRDYLEEVQSIERSGGESVPTSLFNHHEPVQAVTLQDIKTLMFVYYDLYNKEGLSLYFDDLPYIWELLWEIVRKDFFSNKTCRFQCLFLYDNLDQTKSFQAKIDPYHQNTIVKVWLENEDSIERYDAGWLDMISVNCTFNEYFDYCRNYWEGKESKCPNWEYLYVGKYKLGNIGDK